MFDRDGRLVYVSAEGARWLGVEPELLVGRSGRAAAEASEPGSSPASFDILEMIAAAMAAPAGVQRGEAVVQTVRPPALSEELPPPTPRPVMYVPLPAADESQGVVLAVADVTHPLPSTVETAESRRLVDEVHRQLAAAPRRGSSIVTLGSSVAAERLNRQIELASAVFTHVTLVGPPGSPVEAIVRRIHTAAGAGPSAAGPLVPVAGPLMDAELFDATTGHLADRLLEGETATAALLIHDIDQMPRDAQGRLELLVHNHPDRLRIFASTPRSAAAIGEALLPSIAALLGTFELSLPPLCERVEDIPLLATALLERRRAAGETRAEQLGRDALDRLVLYPWPNNFAELDGAIRNAARQCRGETIRVEHLPLAIRSFGAAPESAAPASKSRPTPVPLDLALERLERELIVAALDHSGGNRAAAARRLQISRPRLLRRIEQLGLDGDEAPQSSVERREP